jgi:hypothetical protein
VRLDAQSDPGAPLTGALGDYLPLELLLLQTLAQRRLFQQYVQRYHYLGYRVPYGAQLRYFVRSSRSSRPLLACLLFTSPAWKMAPRDTWIGWSDAARQDQPSPPRQSQPLPHPALGSRPPSRQPYLSSRRSTASARLVHPLSPRPLSWPPSMTPFAQRRDAISPASARRVTLAPSPFTSISAAACASSSFPCLPPSGVPTHSGRPSP